MAVSLQANVAQSLPQQAVKVDALPLRAGEVVEARVVTSGQSGNVQLAIGNALVDAALQVKLQEGALVRLLVQGAPPNIRLTVLPSQGPAAGQQPSSEQALTAQAGPQGSSAQSAQPQPAAHAPAHQAPVQSAGSSPQPSPQSSPPPVRPGAAAQAGPAVAASEQRPVLQAGPQAAVRTSAPVPPGVASRIALVTGGNAGAPTQGSANAAPQSAGAQPLPAGTTLRIQTQGVGPNARPVLVPVQGRDALRPSAQLQAAAQHGATTAYTNLVQQAIAQTVQGSVFRQDSVAALLTSLAGLEGKLSELPRPVAQAGVELLDARLKLDGKPLDGPALKQALQRSGVLLENFLGKGAPVAKGDIKAGLLKLVNVLRTFLGEGAITKTVSDNRPPPPTPGTPPRSGQPSGSFPPPDLSPREAAVRLLGQADAALSRMRLTQLSSLPEAASRGGHSAGLSPEMNIELPLLFGGELSVGQFQILRDGKNGSARDKDGSWKMKFSINFSQTGEVGATVSLRGKKIGVMLWAEREDMAEMLDEMSGELEQMLVARGLEPKAIRVRQGHPPPAKPAIGAFMDNWS